LYFFVFIVALLFLLYFAPNVVNNDFQNVTTATAAAASSVTQGVCPRETMGTTYSVLLVIDSGQSHGPAERLHHCQVFLPRSVNIAFAHVMSTVIHL